MSDVSKSAHQDKNQYNVKIVPMKAQNITPSCDPTKFAIHMPTDRDTSKY